ncbi:MAG: class I SAM-dependent methyltransferase [Gaiellaceae bacterium]
MDSETERVRRLQDRGARHYDRQIGFVERGLLGEGRPWVCGQARGDVLELAVGTGRNLPYYPPGITITGVELSRKMLALAQARAASLGLQPDLRLGDAQALDRPDRRFDTVVCTLGLCTIPDAGRAVAEAHRVLKPGGQLLLLEHVRSPLRAVLAIQRALEPLTVRLAGDHLTREPLDHLRAVGFTLQHVERSRLGLVERVHALRS